MSKKIFSFFLAALACMVLTLQVHAQENEMVKGTIEKIAADSTFIVVDGKTITTTVEFVEEALFEVGDKVEIEVVKEGDALKAVSYQYAFE